MSHPRAYGWGSILSITENHGMNRVEQGKCRNMGENISETGPWS